MVESPLALVNEDQIKVMNIWTTIAIGIGVVCLIAAGITWWRRR